MSIRAKVPGPFQLTADGSIKVCPQKDERSAQTKRRLERRAAIMFDLGSVDTRGLRISDANANANASGPNS